jgi:hypothetical protein
VIATSGVFEPIGEGNASHPLSALSTESERFSLQGASAATQVLRYDGQLDESFILTYSVTAVRVGGGTDEILTRVTLGGTLVEGSEGSAESASASSSITRSTIVSMSPGDELQVEIANGTDTSNFIVQSMRLTVSRVR